MANINTRALTPEDWKIFRDMRIRAVKMHTGYFQENPKEAKSQPPKYWQKTLNGQGKQVFGIFDGDKLIGITGVFTSCEDHSGQTGIMAMSFIEPSHRNKGYSDLLYKARISFAAGHLQWKKLSISHRKGNKPSQHAILKHGFEIVETKETGWPDGTLDTEYVYELDLRKIRSNT